ncbi:MAG: hypothetical protein LBS01_01025 [Prevotellaceae bacterium]|jgi:hypothetical protein|nr:hypothetical protein [Prevotellaceae bacterium]
MVKNYQYPQYLYALRNEEATQNPNTGSWKTTTAVWELEGICREETNGKGYTIRTSGGETIVFSSLIQMPKGAARINEGTQVAVTRIEVEQDEFLSQDFIEQGKISGLIVAAGKCMKYDIGRLHCRMWI